MIFLRQKGVYSVRPKLYWFHYFYLILLASPKKQTKKTKKKHVIKLKKGVGRDAETAEVNCSGPVFVISSIMQIMIILHFLLAGWLFWALHHNVKAWLELYSSPLLLLLPLTCLPSAPQGHIMSSPGSEIQSFFTSYLVPHSSEVWKCGIVWQSKPDIVAHFPQS